jgi:hypothetical protein
MVCFHQGLMTFCEDVRREPVVECWHHLKCIAVKALLGLKQVSYEIHSSAAKGLVKQDVTPSA